MVNLLDVADRLLSGPKVPSDQWDMGLFREISRLVKKYEIKYPGDGSHFNFDEKMPKRLLEAGIEFLVNRGVYCVTTNRVIQFSEQEVRDACWTAPRELVVGEGRDARLLKQRQEDGKDPLNLMPGLNSPFDEDLGLLVVKNEALNQAADYIGGFNPRQVEGREIYGVAMEIYATKRVVAAQREGVRRAGRPGMAISYYPLGTRPEVVISAVDPDNGLRRTDGLQLTVMPDVKIEQSLVSAAVFYEEYGSFRMNTGARGLIGGFCGGVEGAAVEGVARTLGGVLTYHNNLVCTGVDGLLKNDKTMTQKPEYFWGTSLANQAFNRYSSLISFNSGGGMSGPGTEEHLLDQALIAVRCAINGTNLFLPRQSIAQRNSANTPMEGRWLFEVSRATQKAGLTRATADPVMREIADRLKGRPIQPAKHINECWDLVHSQPTPAYRELYLRTKGLLASFGLEFD